MRALLVNCTLKPGDKESNTDALLDIVQEQLSALGSTVERIRLVNYELKPGTRVDHGDGDAWPQVLEKVRAADILILGTPIWMGQICSVAQRFMERMDAIFYDDSLKDPETGNYFTYGKVAGAVVTGNQDGAQSVCRYILWALSEQGYAIPPNASCFWVGDAEGESSFIKGGGRQSLFAHRTARYVAHNLVALHQALKARPIPTRLKDLDAEAEKAL